MLLVGSEPMDRKQMSGVRGVLSAHMASRSRITPSAYLVPITSPMYFLACARVRSGHQHLHTDQNLDYSVEGEEGQDLIRRSFLKESREMW